MKTTHSHELSKGGSVAAGSGTAPFPSSFRAPRPVTPSVMLYPTFLLFFILLFVLSHAQSTPDIARICAPGTYDTGIECEYCPPGTFSLSEQSFTCSECPRGHGVPLSDTVCRPCEPGTFSLQPGAEPCDHCFPGYYTDEYGAVECKKCPNSTFSSGGEAYGPESCIVCPAGSRWAFIVDNVADCIPCEPGTTSTEPNSETCTACPPGTFQNLGEAFEEINPGACRPCPAGSSSDKNGTRLCKPCAGGTYQDIEGQTTCKMCPPNSESELLGSTQCRSTCDAKGPSCKYCPIAWGLDAETGNCTQCATGTVNNQRVETECVQCDAAGGQVSNAHRTECECAAGLLAVTGESGELICESCPDGSSSPDGIKCLCSGGRYMHPARFCDCKPGAKLVAGECVLCEYDEVVAAHEDEVDYYDEEGYDDEHDYEEDYEGEELYIGRPQVNECALCGPGHGLSLSGVCCLPCVNGTANLFVNVRECSGCPGEQVPNEDGTECTCPPGTEKTETGCEKCPAGTYADGPYAVCTKCWPGTFSGPDSAECSECEAGTESLIGASECAPPCPPLSERVEDGSCRCVETAIQVGSKPLKCEQCPGIQLADEARTTCLCSPGEALGEDGICRLCAAGMSGLGGDHPCRLCELGSASDVVGQAYTCHPCESDAEATREGLTACEAMCAVDSFRDNDGKCVTCAPGQRVMNRSCVPCVDGAVSEGGARAFCESCSEGLVLDLNRTRCVRKDGKSPCPPGTRVEGGVCTPCGAGTFSELADSAQCSFCPKGTFQGEGGAKGCTACPQGYVAGDEGKTECTMCAEGSYQDKEGQAMCGRCAQGTKPNAEQTGCE